VFGKKRAEKDNEKPGFLQRLRAHLNQGDSWLTYNLAPGRKIDDDLIDELEAELVMADVGMEAAERIIGDLQKRLARKELNDVDALRQGLFDALLDVLKPVEETLVIPESEGPFVILIVGVNGAGKTTTIGKMAKRLRDEGKRVMLAAADTFRAAAVEQLQIWGERNDVPVISQEAGADPAAVVYDAYQAAKSRGIDVLLADTAGRLQNQQSLMDELTKIKRVVARHHEGAPQEVMLVLDASQGQNALIQAEKFHAALGITGITITKLDGSAKGGILLAIAHKLNIPVRFIGIGERAEDMEPFDAGDFVDALLAESANDIA